MGFNVYWAALPSGGRDSLLAGCNCKVLEAWKGWLRTVAEAQNHNKGSSRRTVTGVHGSATGIQNETVNGGTKNECACVAGTWLHEMYVQVFDTAQI